MRLTLDALDVLDAIARNGSFAAAATELHRVPSAVTYAIQKLEQDLDVVLFDRSGHRARLTPAGERLLHEGRHLLRAARDVEHCVKRVATGWEPELRIALEELLPLAALFPTLATFYVEHPGTRVQLLSEVLGGTWDALASGRADLAVGASGEGPLGGDYTTRSLGRLEFVFAVAPQHVLANAPEPLSDANIAPHRAVVVADSSRDLAPRTAYLIDGQDVLTVPTMATKIEAQRQGLGVGFVPHGLIVADIAHGSLIVKHVASARPAPEFFLAWRASNTGYALAWFIERFETAALGAMLLTPLLVAR